MTETKKIYQNITVKKDGATASIEGEIATEVINKYREQVLKELVSNSELPGFRKGHIPEKIIIEKVGELHLLEDAAEDALKDALPQILEEEKLDVVGRPSADLMKAAPGNPIQFKITVSLFPEIVLPDYKKIAAKTLSEKKAVEVSEKEISDAIKEIKKMRKGKAPEEATEEVTVEENETLTDEEVSAWGPFKSVEEFKEKLQENIKKEKERREKERVRLLIIDTIGKETTLAIPDILIESELNRMVAYFKDDVKRIGVTFEEYLKKVQKNEQDLRKEWRPDAENRVRFELVLDKIGDVEKIVPAEEEIEHEINHIKEHVADTDPARVRPYVTHQIRTQKIFEFLEGQK